MQKTALLTQNKRKEVNIMPTEHTPLNNKLLGPSANAPRNQKIIIISAVAENGIIGAKNAMPWHIPEEFKHFKETTTGHTLIMGDTTYFSIGKALPNRTTIVLSKEKTEEEFEENVKIARSIPEALTLAENHPETKIFIAGGGGVYAQFINIADEMLLSHVKGNYEGDVKFPEVDWTEWKVIMTQNFDEFTVKKYVRKPIK